MQLSTIEKLMKNPHYKLSAKQRQDLADQQRDEMIEFGVPPLHRSGFETHQVQYSPMRRKKKQVLE